METVLEQVKMALRIKTTTFDNAEITPLINACLIDLELAGIKKLDLTDDAIKRAYRDWETDRKSTRLNSSHSGESRMPSSA